MPCDVPVTQDSRSRSPDIDKLLHSTADTGAHLGQMGLVFMLKKLKFLFSKSRCTRESACDAKSKEVNLNNMIAFDALLSPKPLTFEERWRRVMNFYHKQGDEEKYDFDDAETALRLLKFCGMCGLSEIDESGWMEEKGC
uniref:Expressed conserved protein n=1 Tax=Echinococcus granulosus TaxID=6210 RepID=A0A068WT32_ECHGR|nr:hypothetical protein EgrG_002037200 [Echinococcus granulosus]